MHVAWLGLALIGCGRFGFQDQFASVDAVSLGDAAIAGCGVPSAGAVACYHFDGNGADSALQDDATTTSVTYGAGRLGQAVQLDASSLITAPTTAATHLMTTGTISAWLHADTLPTAGVRSTYLDTNNYVISLLSTGDIECSFTGVHHTFTTGIAVGTWTHVACAYDGSAVTVWVDGTVVQSQADSGPVMNSGMWHLQIGSNIPDPGHPNADPFLGTLDEVGLWNVALTTADVCAAAGTC